MCRYGDDVKVVGLADGGACLEDPDGLHAGELQRLVSNALPLSAFDRARLGLHGALTLTDTLEGARRRDTMHSRVLADVFVPAGGRPVRAMPLSRVSTIQAPTPYRAWSFHRPREEGWDDMKPDIHRCCELPAVRHRFSIAQSLNRLQIIVPPLRGR